MQLTNEELRTKRKAAKKADFLQNAEKSKKYYGRRYLGTTNNGKDIWITMRFDRIDLQISLEVNGDLDDLFEEGAALAPVRVTQRLGNKKPNLQDFMQVHRKNAGGQVTPRTIEYIKKLINDNFIGLSYFNTTRQKLVHVTIIFDNISYRSR